MWEEREHETWKVHAALFHAFKKKRCKTLKSVLKVQIDFT